MSRAVNGFGLAVAFACSVLLAKLPSAAGQVLQGPSSYAAEAHAEGLGGCLVLHLRGDDKPRSVVQTCRSIVAARRGAQSFQESYSWTPVALGPAYEEAERALSGRYDGVSGGRPIQIVVRPGDLINAGIILDENGPTNGNAGSITIFVDSALIDFVEATVSAYMIDILRGSSDDQPGLGYKAWLSQIRASRATSLKAWNAPWPGPSNLPSLDWNLKYVRVPAQSIYAFVFGHELSHRVLNLPSGGDTAAEQLRRESVVDLNAFDHLGVTGPNRIAMAMRGEIQPTFIVAFLAAVYYFEKTRQQIIADQVDLPGQSVTTLFPARDWKVRASAVLDHWNQACTGRTSATMCPTGVAQLIAEGRDLVAH